MHRKIIITGLLISVGIAIFISPFASHSPDGLEKVAKTQNFISKADGSARIKSPIASYLFPGIKNKKVATSLAGLIGSLITFLIIYFTANIFRLIKKMIYKYKKRLNSISIL